VAGIVVAIIGFLFYFLNLKNKKINSLEAQVDLADTKQQAAVIDEQVKQKQQAIDANDTRMKTINDSVSNLDQQRADLKQKVANQTVKETEDFWNKK
jgi:hypothetical protein